MDIDGQKRLGDQWTRWVERLYRVNRDALAALTALQKQAANITVDWLYRFNEGTVDPIDAAFDNAIEQAYVLSLSLEQLYKYTSYLKPIWVDALRDAGLSYRSAYGSTHMNDLRDLFEHEADYVAGYATRPKSLSLRTQCGFLCRQGQRWRASSAPVWEELDGSRCG